MTIHSRWSVDIPRCSLQQWIFGSASGPMPNNAQANQKLIMDPERPDTHFLTLDQYRLLAKRVALGLQRAGLQTGERVLLFAGNSLYFPAVFLGVLMAGGVFTGANPTFVGRELAYQLQDSGATFLLVAEGALDIGLEAAARVGLPREKLYVLGGDTSAGELAEADQATVANPVFANGTRHWTALLSGNLSTAQTWHWTEPSSPSTTTCCLNYSSGTTGTPKGVEITHTAYVANGVGVDYVRSLDPNTPAYRARAVGLAFLPMYHAYGQTMFVANLPAMRTPYYVMPKFDFLKTLEYVQKYRVTSLTCVPPIVVALSKHPAVCEYDLSSIEGIGCGAAPLSKEVIDRVERRLKHARIRVQQGWGMTEVTCTCMALDPTRGADAPADSVGELMPNCAARLVSTDGQDTPIETPDTPGELWVSGPTMLRAYWNRPEATAQTVVVDPNDGRRWLRTGDIAYVAGSYGPGSLFHVIDRLKELIKVKGNQVAPAELEGVLLDRADVVDVAVVGVTVAGEEVPRAYVVRKEGSTVTERDLAEWMAGRVAPYKRLRGGVRFVADIPKNPSGKILRKQLRELAASEVGRRKPAASKLA